MKNGILIAVGGNSLIRAGQKGTIDEQFENARPVCERIADLVGRGFRVALTHGNGPQVGSQLLRSEAGSSQTYTLPLDVCVAMTQGEIGYILQTTLQSVFRERKLSIPVAALITQVLVGRNDPAFAHPTKPIGPFYSPEAAGQKQEELGWDMVDDAARGFRRVVPSPKPCTIVEMDVIRICLENGMIVIASGGGGIPVIADNGRIRGVEAVVDKDRASALFALEVGIPRMIISTDVESVCLHFRQPQERSIRLMTLEDAKRYLERNEFHEGSMKPKIEAAIQFLEGGGEEVIITNPEHILPALDGSAGTHIVQANT